ncbi:hypothetical protein HU200_040561 [Digitaria exilis]|uniref:peptidylprolyl isomerase n=1 Tax=Digitaria exilis TaxID=1010633 RepID=A0A835BGY4_9POAL|nr:hypothetical protein HU200_040561 [Digitaria exilis]
MESAWLTSLANPFPCTSQSRLSCRRKKAFSLKATCGLYRRSAVSGMVVLGAAASIDPLSLSMPVKAAMPDADVIRYRKLDSGVKLEDVVEGEGPEAQEGDLVQFNYVCRRANGYFVHSTVDQFSGESKPVTLPLGGEEVIASLMKIFQIIQKFRSPVAMIRGLKDVLIGMKVGGKRRALIPPEVGYISETLKPIPEENVYFASVCIVHLQLLFCLPCMLLQFGPRRSLLSHAKEPLVFEVQLLKVL